MYKNIQAVIKDRQWRPGIGMSSLDGASNYAGEHFNDWVYIYGQSRDADTLTRCNFACILNILGGESKTVQVIRTGHWGCGWVESILVKKTSKAKLEIARSILNDLESYGVVDEYELSRMEWDEAEETIENYRSNFTEELFKFLGFKRPDLTPRHNRASEVLNIISYIYHHSCGYSGPENAWVSDDSIQRWLDQDGQRDLTSMAKDGNKLARAVISRGLVLGVD